MKKNLLLAGLFPLLLSAIVTRAVAGDGTWNVDAAGNWNTAANWSPVAVPGTAAGNTVGLAFNISANRIVTVDTAVTLGILNIGDANNTHSYTLAPSATPNSCTFNNSGSSAQLNQVSTSKGDTISQSLTLSDSLTIANSSANTLAISGSMNGAKSVTISSGTVALSPSQTRSVTTVNGSTAVTMTTTAGLLAFQTISGTGIPSGAFISSVDSGTQITISAAATAGGTVTGTFTGSTYSGGTTVNGGTLLYLNGATAIYGSSAVKAGVFGTGTLTLADGTSIGASGNNGGVIGNGIALNGNIKLGGTASRIQLQGPIDLGGTVGVTTRNVSLIRGFAASTANITTSGQENIQIGTGSGGPAISVANGTLRFINDASVAAGNYTVLRVNAGWPFTGNAGLTLGDHVMTTFGTGTPFTTPLPALTLESGSVFNMSDNATTRGANVFSLSGSGTVVNLAVTTAGTALLGINGTATATFSGNIVDGQALASTFTGIGSIVGLVAVTKSGSGTQIFSGANTYSGATTISASGGTLFVNGTHTVSSGTAAAYTVNGGGATLGGNGTIDLSAVNLGVTVNNGGKLSPGSATSTAGILTMKLGAAQLNISSALGTAGSLVFDIDTTSTSDKILLNSGTLNIGSGLLNFSSFSFNALAGIGAGTYTLISTPNTISGTLGSSLTGTIGSYGATISLSGDSKSILLTLAAPKANPIYSGLTASQTIPSGTSGITLTGNLVATGPVYPANGATISVTINGSAQNGTFTDAVGNFSVTYNPSAIPVSSTPYTITYSFAGDANLNPANDATTTLTVSTNVIWTGTANSDFENGGSGKNWSGYGAPINDLTSHLGVFSSTPTANRPALTTSRSISGLSLTTTTGGWTLASSNVNNILSLGVNGVSTTGQTGGTNYISANLNVATNQTWKVGTGGNLLITGSITNTLSPVTNYSLTINASGSTGNVILSPAAGNSVNLVGTNGGSVINVKSGGLLELGGDGVTAPATTSTNSIINGGGAYGAWGVTSGKVQVNSGTWITGDIGRNNGSDAFAGTFEVNGGYISFTGMRYFGTGTFSVNGGTVTLLNGGTPISNGGKLALGNIGTGTALMNITGGFVDLATANGINGFGNGIASVTSAMLNQSGGVLQNGVTVSSGAGSGNVTTFTIGGSNLVNTAAFTLAGGTFVSAGTVQAFPNTTATLYTSSTNNFNFMGGTLAIAGFNTANLGSSGAATVSANQTASSDNIGTLVNYGGALSPGGGVNSSGAYTNGAGRTTITGNYSVSNNTATLAIDIGGTNQANSFQSGATYDFVAISGNATLGGALNVGFLGGYVPTGGEIYTVLSATNGLAGNFTSTNLPSLPVATPALNWFVSQTPTNFNLMVNRAPAATVMNVARTAGLSLKIPFSDLATNWTDDDGNAVTLNDINLVTTNNVNLLTNATFIFYTNSPNVNDQISYTIRDGQGGVTTGLVNIIISSSVTGTNSITGITTGGTNYVNAFGIPGYSYVLQRATNLSPAVWLDVSTNVAANNGVISAPDAFNDLGGTPPVSAYYQLKWQP